MSSLNHWTIFLGHGFTRHAQSLDGISLPLKRAILLDQLFPWVMLCLTSVFLLSSPTFTELFTKMCSDVFGSKFTPGLLKRGIRVIQRPLFCFATTSLSYEFQSTLREYGGRELVSSVSNVAFVHVSHLESWYIWFYRELLKVPAFLKKTIILRARSTPGMLWASPTLWTSLLRPSSSLEPRIVQTFTQRRRWI